MNCDKNKERDGSFNADSDHLSIIIIHQSTSIDIIQLHVKKKNIYSPVPNRRGDVLLILEKKKGKMANFVPIF